MSDSATKTGATEGRLLSLDCYRGIVMFLLAANGFGIVRAAAKSESLLLEKLRFFVTHPQWESHFHVLGFSPWDMIQPAFMFMVGVSMPWSYAKRKSLGHSYPRRLGHAWTRALILVLLGVFLQSVRRGETNWLFTNVLSQIGLGYGFLFLLAGLAFRTQAIVGGIILLGYYAWFLVHPDSGTGILGHFAQGENTASATHAAAQFDRWFLNLFPREKPFLGHSYFTLNFIPSLVTMLFGLMCGQILKRKDTSSGRKLKALFLFGALCLVLGLLWSPLCPIVKKIWSPSWTLFSGAYVIWALALLYLLIDVVGLKKWTFPFVVVGLNPIAIYFMSMIMKPFFAKNLRTHLPDACFQPPATGHIVEACLVLLCFWLILFWMYRRRIFLRI